MSPLRRPLRHGKAVLVLALASLVGVLLCGCSTVSVTTDYDVTAPFTDYRTYALEPPANAPLLSPGADAALRIALHENLAARGIREVGVNNRPDLAFVLHARSQQRRTREQYNHWGYGVGGWPFGAGYYGMWIGEPYPTTTVERDAKENIEQIGEAVEKIVARFPATGAGPVAGDESITSVSLSP